MSWINLFRPPGVEPDFKNRDPASGELSVYQQAGEGAATADLGDQPATRQEQVETSSYTSALLEVLEVETGLNKVLVGELMLHHTQLWNPKLVKMLYCCHGCSIKNGGTATW